MILQKIELPILAANIFWYKDFASEILELDYSFMDDDEAKGILIHALNLTICCRPTLVKKNQIFNKLDFLCPEGTTAKELEQKLELFVYKHRSSKVINEIHFFQRALEGREQLILKDPSGHEWAFE